MSLTVEQFRAAETISQKGVNYTLSIPSTKAQVQNSLSLLNYLNKRPCRPFSISSTFPALNVHNSFHVIKMFASKYKYSWKRHFTSLGMGIWNKGTFLTNWPTWQRRCALTCIIIWIMYDNVTFLSQKWYGLEQCFLFITLTWCIRYALLSFSEFLYQLLLILLLFN